MYPLSHGDTLVFGDVVCVFILAGATGVNQSLRPPIRGRGMSATTAESTRLGARTAPSLLDTTRSPLSTLRPATTAMSNYSREEHDMIRDQVSNQGIAKQHGTIRGQADQPLQSRAEGPEPAVGRNFAVLVRTVDSLTALTRLSDDVGPRWTFSCQA